MSKLSPISIAFLLFPNITQLDLTGPAQILSGLGNTKLDLVWKDKSPVTTDSGFNLLPTATFDEIKHADILCVPGGFGTIDLMQDETVLNWVRDIAETSQWITSVCTGSLVLAASGILKGKRSACHWASIDQLTYFGAIPVRERVVTDGKFISGGGVTAGIDFAFTLMEKIRGRDHAQLVQLALEYDPAPPLSAGSPDKADPSQISAYHSLVEARVPNRDKVVREIAIKLGFHDG